MATEATLKTHTDDGGQEERMRLGMEKHMRRLNRGNRKSAMFQWKDKVRTDEAKLLEEGRCVKVDEYS